MAWPTSTDYNEVIQNPGACFADADLRAAMPEASGVLGTPQPFSGNFADVYKMLGSTRNWAVKCFTREVQGLQARYQAISEHLSEQSRPFMVDFRYIEQGIKVKGAWYPVVKMSWVEGFALNQFIADHATEPGLLEKLGELWVKLASQLRDAGMAHGDLQHGNVLLVPGSKANSLALKLIDYDGMFVPALASTPSGELGHRNYQHPQRRDNTAYHPEMDRFAHLTIYTALRCVRVAGGLWSKYGDPENLLFRQSDFATPAGSALLRELWHLPDRDARALAGHLVLASIGPLAQVPMLAELITQGQVRQLERDEELRVEALLSTTIQRKSDFNPRAQQTPITIPTAMASATPTTLPAKPRSQPTVPPLPSPLQPATAVRRRTPFPVPPAPDTISPMQPVLVPSPPPLPVLTVVPLPPPLPANEAMPLPMEAVIDTQARQTDEMEPHPLPLPQEGEAPIAARYGAPIPFVAEETPRRASGPVPAPAVRPSPPSRPVSPPPRRPARKDDDEWVRSSPNRTALIVGGVVLCGALLVALIVYLVKREKPTTNAPPPPKPPPPVMPQVISTSPVSITGGDSKTIHVKINRRGVTGEIRVELDKISLPEKVTAEPLVLDDDVTEGDVEITADILAPAATRKPVVKLFRGETPVDEYGDTGEITVIKRAVPRFGDVPREVKLKSNQSITLNFVVDPQGSDLIFTVEAGSDLPDAVEAEQLLVREGIPPLKIVPMHFTSRNAVPGSFRDVRFDLNAGNHTVDSKFVRVTVEGGEVQPGLGLLPQTLPVPANGRRELPVSIQRQGYRGEVHIHIEGNATGVLFAHDFRLLGEQNSVPVEFRSNGALPGTAFNLKVSTVVNGQPTDSHELALVVEQPPEVIPPRPPTPDGRGPQDVELKTADEVTIQATYYPGPENRRCKCVLMLHDLGQNRKEANWRRLAERLNRDGYAVLAIDFRGHGGSTRVAPSFWEQPFNRSVQPGSGERILYSSFPLNYPLAMVNDVQAAKAFLDEKDRAGQVDAANLVLIGARAGAVVGSFWIAAETHRYRPADNGKPGAPGAVPVLSNVPESKHITGAIWIDFAIRINRSSVLNAERTWLTAIGQQQIPMYFLYGALDSAAQKETTLAVNISQQVGRFNGSRPMPIPNTRDAGHVLLNPDLATETLVAGTVLQLFTRPDGAAFLPRPAQVASWWTFPTGQSVPARQDGEAVYHLVPGDRLGVPILTTR
jgi:pimeloyl-ACP methyl ester carboxylesterase